MGVRHWAAPTFSGCSGSDHRWRRGGVMVCGPLIEALWGPSLPSRSGCVARSSLESSQGHTSDPGQQKPWAGPPGQGSVNTWNVHMIMWVHLCVFLGEDVHHLHHILNVGPRHAVIWQILCRIQPRPGAQVLGLAVQRGSRWTPDCGFGVTGDQGGG